jgi:acetate kinase
MRSRICSGLEFLGIRLETDSNDNCFGTEMLISEANFATPVWVIPTNEELIVARATLKVISEQSIK